MTASNILIWNEEVGFVRINEGNGSNLFEEDEEAGYVDYIMLDFLTYNGYELIENDGSQVMLYEMYQDKFNSVEEVIQHMIDYNWIPNTKYTVLYAE